MFGVRHAGRGRFQHLLARRFQRLLQSRRRHPLAPVDHGKQIPQCVTHPLAVSLIVPSGQRQQELHVTDQVGHAELHQHVELPHVLAVGAEIIAAQHAVELLAEHRHQHLRSPRLVDAKEGVKLGAEAPSPELLAILLVPCLVDVQHGFARQPLEQLGIRLGQRLTHFANQLGQVAPRHLDADDITQELADGAERGVADAFHEGDQGRQPRAEQPRLDDCLGQRGVMEFLAVRAPVGQALMLADDRRRCRDFHLLERLRRPARRNQGAAAVGAAVEGVGDDAINSLGREWCPQVLVMPRLRATVPFLAALAPVFESRKPQPLPSARSRSSRVGCE